MVQAPNTYTLSAELPGFKKYVNVDNYLATRVTQRFDVRLEVGEVAEQVTVQQRGAGDQHRHASNGVRPGPTGSSTRDRAEPWS